MAHSKLIQAANEDWCPRGRLFKCAISRFFSLLLQRYSQKFIFRKESTWRWTSEITWRDVNKCFACVAQRNGTNTSRTCKGRKKRFGRNWFSSQVFLPVLHCWLFEHDNEIPETWFCDNSFLKSSFMTNHFCYVWIRLAYNEDTDNRFCNVIISRREKLFVYLRRSPYEISMVTGLTFEGSFENSNVTNTLKVLFADLCARSRSTGWKLQLWANVLNSMSSILINT